MSVSLRGGGARGGVHTGRYGRVLLQLGVLAVVVAAPLGGAAVALSAERLLTKQEPQPLEVDAEAGGGLKPGMSIERMSVELEPTAAPRL